MKGITLREYAPYVIIGFSDNIFLLDLENVFQNGGNYCLNLVFREKVFAFDCSDGRVKVSDKA